MNPSAQIQSLFSDNSESLILGRLGTNFSLHFSGPPHGVLPIGPNGFHGLGILQPSPLSDAETNVAILSYNYTLNHQGLTTSISCIYDTQSPIRFLPVLNDTTLVKIDGFCNETGQASIIDRTEIDWVTLSTDQTLALWVCKSSELPTGEQDPTYHIYLRGSGVNYEENIGNISCTVLMQPAIFPVTYQSSTGVFSTQEQITTSALAHGDAFSDLVEEALFMLVIAARQAQTTSVNLIADSVDALGYQAMGLRLEEQKEKYLPLYGAMIQGMLVDEVCIASSTSCPLLKLVLQFTFLRFLYSRSSIGTFGWKPAPAACNHTVNGTLSAEVTGWVAKPVHIGFLMPMTILNLASLIIVLISIARAKRDCYEFDPTDPRSLVLAESSQDESDHSGWEDSVSYRSREVRECRI